MMKHFFVVLIFTAFSFTSSAFAAISLDDNADISYGLSSERGTLDYITKSDELTTSINMGSYQLWISEEAYTGTNDLTVTEDDGREFPFSTHILSELTVSRKVFVPDDSNFVRYLNILKNTTASDITVDVKISGQLASTSNTVVYNTSDSDSEVETDDLWVATNGNTTRLAMANIWDGPSGSEVIDSVNLNTTTGNFDWTWLTVTVPEGETVILMFFGVPQIDGETAAQRAGVIATFSDTAMLSGISNTEINAVVNWGFGDEDGIDGEEEDGAPNQGDGNNDGIPDKFQKHVTSMQMYNSANYVTIVAPRGSSLSDCKSSAVVTTGKMPSYVTFDHGSIGFTVNDITAGDAIDVTIILPTGIRPDTYFKYGPTSTNNSHHWYEFLYDGEKGAEINGNKVTLHLIDGERGDSDLRANGRITDPGSPGELDGSTSDSCFINTLK